MLPNSLLSLISLETGSASRSHLRYINNQKQKKNSLYNIIILTKLKIVKWPIIILIHYYWIINIYIYIYI